MSPSDTYTAVEVRSTIRTFRDYLNDLVRAPFDQFPTKLRLFVNFCERDEAFRLVAHHLTARGTSPREWYTQAAQPGGRTEMPEGLGRFDRLGFVYRTLHEVKQQRIDLRSLLSTLFRGMTSITDAFARFKATWLEPFRSDLSAALDAIERALPEDGAEDKVDFGALAYGALEGGERRRKAPAAERPPAQRAPAAPADEPGPAAEPAERTAPASPTVKTAAKTKARAAAEAPPKAPLRRPPDERDLPSLLKDLAVATRNQRGIKAPVRKDLATDLKILRLELSKGDPNRDVLLSVIEPMERHGGKVAELAAAIAIKLKRSSAVG